MDERKQYINLEHPVYISYAWAKDNEGKGNEEDVNRLCKLMDEQGIYFKRDKAKGDHCLCPYRHNITEAEEEIGKGDTVIVVISREYIRSLHCMHEWHCICQTGNIPERVFAIMLPGANLKKVYRYNSFRKHLEDRLKEISDKDVNSSLETIEQKFLESEGYLEDLEKLREYLTNYVNPDSNTLREDNYAVLVQQLKERVITTSGTRQAKTEGGAGSAAPAARSFSVGYPSNLLERNVEPLHQLVSRNRFSNLFGFGGSGKTSLMYLYLQRYRSEFNEVAYVVVNNGIKADLVSQINDTIHLFDPGDNRPGDEAERYWDVVSFLESYYKADKPNLLVIDINNAPEGDLAKFTEDLANNTLPSNRIYPKGWKFLIVSRERCTCLANMDMNKRENEDTDFLKSLFLEHAGREKYHHYSDDDFARLFRSIHYSPLLAEQLGIFLQDLPAQSVDQITALLHKNTFRGERRIGVTAQNRSSEEEATIVGFLRNLLVFGKLRPNEQQLLRHFVLWPTDFIPRGVIADLLRGLFKDDDDLEDALIRLVSRRILSFQDSDDVTKYKLHGLMAESLYEQIDTSREDYSGYLSNIERIIRYGYYDFLPFTDCIGNSLCEKNITNDPYVLGTSANKFQKTWSSNYAKTLYEKCIDVIKPVSTWKENLLASVYNNLALLQKNQLGDYRSAEANYKKAIKIGKRLPEDNPEFQNDLANAHNNLANLQVDHLEDYSSAESNYKKAIEIRERLPKDNPEIQNGLASTYNNLANLQDDHLGDYPSAESNYKKAIEIREQLPKDNFEFQNGLAKAYNNLAVLQEDHLRDYPSAEANYKKAIRILERLPKDNPEFQNDLAMAYYNLANLQVDHLEDYSSAESNYKKAIEIRERLPKDNPEIQNGLASTYNNLANLQDDHLGDYPSAESNYKKAIEIREQLPKDNFEFQNGLAKAYNNLAVLQEDHLRDYPSAEANYKKAIEICERLPKDNPEFQNLLAKVRNNLANLQSNH